MKWKANRRSERKMEREDKGNTEEEKCWMKRGGHPPIAYLPKKKLWHVFLLPEPSVQRITSQFRESLWLRLTTREVKHKEAPIWNFWAN